MTPTDESGTEKAHIDQTVVDALGSLGNRKRLEILLALTEAERETQEQWLTMSFTELYDAVGIESTSQFSYHLDRLVGWFVAETPDGYRLTYGGDKLVRTILSGVYETTQSFDDVAVAGTCVFCEDTSLVATMDTERFVVRCRSCETTLLTDMLPRSQTRNRSPTAIVDSVGARIWSSYTLVRGGVCPECYGPVDTVVDTHDPETDEDEDRTFYALSHTCQECWLAVHMPIEVTAAFHPVTAAFFWEHGISLPDVPIWEFFEYIATETIRTDVASTDPLEATVTVTFGDETLRLEMDDTFTVTPEPAEEN
ncbi:ArsR family transcriptional regulator [Natronorubrum sp. JWXQ-INN-674]|uniref:ArsR family transcriptional regulator n=1 Tax=Natronorubrum halalkaliphilum TaxID=2691917 RepID=A0A6B0VUD4_9EURY|nr:winged helix-turn-helix domain-containing protein [Natronorubrum halalkaliphilum]MXV64516.1 ArsR family transcriptional regulator [Natronorubrum halalkaliphilum]